MNEAGGEAVGGTPEEARQRLIQRSVEDEGFRQRLLTDPKGTVERELGARLPEEIQIRAVEETPDTIYLVLPPSQQAGAHSGGELSDRELEAVAGGWNSTLDYTCSTRACPQGCGQNGE